MSKRLPRLEKEFKKRYNRDVEIRFSNKKEGEVIKAIVKIVSDKGSEYILTDKMVEGETVAAFLEVGGKKYKYRRYVDAEIHCADLIGAEAEGE